MDYAKQLSSAVKNASSGTSNPTNTLNDKDNSSNNAAQSGVQAPDLANIISRTMASLGAGGKNSSAAPGVDDLHLPADLSNEQLGQLGSQLGAAVKAEQAQRPDKSAEAIGTDTLKQVRDLQSQGQLGVAAALQGGLHQAAEKEALEGTVEQRQRFLTQKLKDGGVATADTADTAPAPAPASANKPPVTRSKAAELGGDSTGFS
ncbi:hypothetical protein PG984_001776 [Apiospora sp. TS-2023a]